MNIRSQASPAVKHPFHIQLVNQENPWPLNDTTHRLNNYEMIWLEDGAMSIDVNLKTFETKKKTISLLAPGQIRKLKFSNLLKAVYFQLPADFFYQLSSQIRFPAITPDFHHLGRLWQIQLTDSAQDELKEVFFKMYNEFLGCHESRNQLLTGWLKIFLLYVARNISSHEEAGHTSRDTELARRFMELVSKDFITKKMVSEYAGELLVTPNYLNQIVKRVSGFPASHHIQQYVIMEAKRQATQSCRSMKEIAYDLGFDDLAHFSKFFKSKSGINFSSFKKSAIHG
ncbi:helix-turn-helix domain-containing protein [Flavitalea antarctica]